MEAIDFKYIDEGNANVAVAYTGSNIVYKNKILRIPKKKVDMRKIYENYTYIYNTMLPEYRMNLELIGFEKDFIRELMVKIDKERNRNDELDLACEEGLLMDNLVSGEGSNVLAVEIKPKWGFVPPEYSACRFCLHEELKARKKNIPLGKFCPLDLYSGDFNRILKSVNDLRATPKNNLKIFYQQENITDKPIYIGGKNITNLIASILYQCPVLQNIKHFQEKFHDNVEELYQLKMNLEEHLIHERLSNFMTSVCLKDLSLMISFYVDNTNLSILEEDNHLVESLAKVHLSGGEGAVEGIPFKVTAIDLDYKNESKIAGLKDLEVELKSVCSKKCSLQRYLYISKERNE
ncbi:Inositol-pentakisphosphate 2-kinase [Boothiomyces macroporosus]|uniref:Inositol-pentakisphosphate 2-kinase n=1 Tax=Boothiomyces macroporosus TaxID=261099 RepID=A0AAD5UKR0_9FUNG|nr:Inositol-pentakisphosphate 2-kinase [Boothiomyces macroporosus]